MVPSNFFANFPNKPRKISAPDTAILIVRHTSVFWLRIFQRYKPCIQYILRVNDRRHNQTVFINPQKLLLLFTSAQPNSVSCDSPFNEDIRIYRYEKMFKIQPTV